MLERDIEKKFVAKVKRMGGEAVKFTSPASRGWPDRLVVLPGGRVTFVELKTAARARTNTTSRTHATTSLSRITAMRCR